MNEPRNSSDRFRNKQLSYDSAGVSIERGDAFAEFIKTLNPAVVGADLGGFAGGLELDLSGYRRPVLFSATDGVGTKLLLAEQLGNYDTLGIDLVAMCVNDLIVCGARPVAFLDYIACGRLEPSVLEPVMRGIVRGCELAGCRLLGGETAEMPGLYQGSRFDLAGFAVGIAERETVLPQPQRMQAGDVVFGLPSSGIHSNGLSLARKVLERLEAHERQELDALQRELLEPTVIYVEALKRLLETGVVTGAAHITGGGLEANTQRALPSHLTARFRWDWPTPRVFTRLAELGEIPEHEMRRVFNMGVGLALIVPHRHRDAIELAAEHAEIEMWLIGELADG